MIMPRQLKPGCRTPEQAAAAAKEVYDAHVNSRPGVNSRRLLPFPDYVYTFSSKFINND